MSPEQEAQRARIKAARAELDAAIRAHTHVYSDAGCAVCGTNTGWECPESPDGRCHYFTERGDDRKVVLTDGTVHLLTEPVPSYNQTDDACLFCGEPEERK